MILIRALPPDSATRQAMSGGEPPWGRTDYLLADLIDAVNAGTWVAANLQVERNKRQPFPDPYPRPSAETEKAKPVVTAEALLAHRERTRKGK